MLSWKHFNKVTIEFVEYSLKWWKFEQFNTFNSLVKLINPKHPKTNFSNKDKFLISFLIFSMWLWENDTLSSFIVAFKHDEVHVYVALYFQDYLLDLQNDPVKSKICKQRVLCRTLAGNLVYVLTITSPSQNPEDIKVKRICSMFWFAQLFIMSIEWFIGKTNRWCSDQLPCF